MTVAFTILGIVALRLIDVSIGALRIQYLVRGRRALAGGLGFFESLTWVATAAWVLSDLDEWYKVVAYAAGFGLGTALGGLLDSWIGSGQVFLRVMASVDAPPVAPTLRDLGFGATVINGQGLDGDVRLTICALPRRRLGEALDAIKMTNPHAFVTADEIDAFSAQAMPATRVRK